MLLRKFVLHTVAFAVLSACIAGDARAQTKTTVKRAATTSPLIINLGTGTTPAATGVKRLTFTTGALTMNLVTGAPAANVAGVKRQAFTTGVLTMNLVAGAPAANVAGVKRQAFTTAALTMNLIAGAPAATAAGVKRQTFTTAVLALNLGSQSAPQTGVTKRAATTQPLVFVLK